MRKSLAQPMLYLLVRTPCLHYELSQAQSAHARAHTMQAHGRWNCPHAVHPTHIHPNPTRAFNTNLPAGHAEQKVAPTFENVPATTHHPRQHTCAPAHAWHAQRKECSSPCRLICPHTCLRCMAGTLRSQHSFHLHPNPTRAFNTSLPAGHAEQVDDEVAPSSFENVPATTHHLCQH